MLRLILKQLWAGKRSNGWMMGMLILVTFFLWIVIDPLFVLLANKAIPQGYDTDQTCLLTVSSYPSVHSRYKEEESTDSAMHANFLRILDEVRRYRGVEAATLVIGYPFSTGYNGCMIYKDTFSLQVQTMGMYRYGEYFQVFRIADVNTGKWEGLDEKIHDPGQMVITRGIEQLLFPGQNAVGQTFTLGTDQEYRVAAVVDDFKARSVSQPNPLFFLPKDKLYLYGSPRIAFRICDDLSVTRFMEEFQREMRSRVSIGNYYFLRLEDFHSIRRKSEYLLGATNTLRRQSGMTVFFLLSVFLGVSGTFWVRSTSRRGEIGLMIALGSSHRNIRRSFLLESWLLTTIAWIAGILMVLQKVCFSGFAYDDKAVYLESMNSMYIQNLPVPHFLVVSLIVYLLLIGIAFVATWIPARRAAATEPSEALRDE